MVEFASDQGDTMYWKTRQASCELPVLSKCAAMLALTLALTFTSGHGATQTTEIDTSKICTTDEKNPRIRLGVREDAPPFSYEVTNRRLDQGSDPYSGYTVELCIGFVRSAQNKSGLDDYCFVEVDPSSRLHALGGGYIDLLCGATTASVDIRAEYRTSLMTYLAVSGLSYMRKGPVADRSLGDQQMVRLGVREDTTSQTDLTSETLPGPLVAFLDSSGLKDYGALKRVDLADHWEAPKMLRDGAIDIYLADRPIIEAVLAGGSEDIQVYNLPIALQPYSVIIAGRPFGRDERAGVELQRNFDRFLIEEKFAPDKVDAYFDHLRELLQGNIEPFFLEIARVQGVFP
ncbi:transporter substrate-binding domain-containing protein [Sedimentitalea sp.]|uniref:transporter substrate-binding domain-containing protein n=1 Tax=Sedimentitalea sp. TaxID=2048915 RepID=UPI0032970F20